MDVILYSKLSELKKEITNNSELLETVTEEYGTTKEWEQVVIDTTKQRSQYRCADSVGNRISKNYQSGTTGWTSTDVSDCLAEVFDCVAGKKYRITVTNGATSAAIGERGFFVVAVAYQADYWKVAECIRKSNTSSAKDIYEITPTVSGHVYLNLDANFQSVSVDVEVDVPTKTAIDNYSRDIIDEMSENVPIGFDWKNVTIDSSDVYEGHRTNDTIGSYFSKEGTSGYVTASKTDVVRNAFTCEAGKTYRVKISNGGTPSATGDRATVIVAQDRTSDTVTVKWKKVGTTTSNPIDIVEFMPDVSGYVYFNLDANYQSIEVEKKVILYGKRANDSIARSIMKYVVHSEIVPDIEFESGTFDYTLEDETGEGYRSDVITGVKDCAVCIKVDAGYTAMFGNGTDSLVTVHGSFVYHSTKDNLRLWISDTVANSGFEVRIYKEKGHRGIYDVIVAASNSTEDDKAIADIVCDGANDEVDLQFAANWNFGRRVANSQRDNCNVLLLPGVYNIDKFAVLETLYGEETVAQFAVMVGNDTFNNSNSYRYTCMIEGASVNDHISAGSVTKLNVTSSGVSSLDGTKDNVVIGVARAGSNTGGRLHMNTLSIIVKNLAIYTNGMINRIIGIDGYTAGMVDIENCEVWSKTSGSAATDIAAIPDGSIGIRAGIGSCYGVRQIIKGNRISGYYEGISIVGEHFIVQDNLEYQCYYGFVTNRYSAIGAVQHPNIFIGNSVEQCYKLGKLGESGNKATIIYIGGSVENLITHNDDEPVAMQPIEISATTKNRGRIESDSLADPYDGSLFESGMGDTFEQTIYPYTQA